MGGREAEAPSPAPRRLILRPQATDDVTQVSAWYEYEKPGLGDEFLLALDAGLAEIQRHPLAHRSVGRRVRRMLLRRFPYKVYYIITPTTIFVLGVMHVRRRPGIWRQRL